MNLRISTINSLTVVANFPSIWKGQYENLEIIFDYLVEKVSIETDPETEFQIGGDPVGKRRKVHLGLSPEPIRLVDFYAPPRGNGAAVAPERRAEEPAGGRLRSCSRCWHR